ncbi:hypothetical protein ACFQ2B_27625 [Streptomyces stramineus]|uniref:Uncharacterized protein n=1 Tax=Streptomyces stramineus TaxID=173861 RepID=A0ABN0ZPB5_9ACTN
MNPFSAARSLARHRGKSSTQLRHECDELTCQLIAATTQIGQLTRERNVLEAELDQAAIDISGALQDKADAEAELARIKRADATHSNA